MSIDRYPPRKGSKHSRWRARWRDPNGRQKTKVFDRKVDAERWMIEIEHRKHVGEYVDPAAGRVTFRDYAEPWRERQVHAPSTRQQVETYFRRHVMPTLGDMELRAIRPSDIQSWVTKCSKTLAPGTVELMYRYVAKLLLDAQHDRLIARTPCVGIKLPKKPKPKMYLPTTDQLVAVTEKLPDRYRVITLLCAGAGLRISEALGLRVEDVDFLRRELHVRDQLAGVVDGEPKYGPTKSPAGVRVVPLGEVVVKGIAAHLARFPVSGNGLIVTNDLGQPLGRSKAGHLWRAACKKADVDDIRLHDLRHYFASALISAGCSVKAVQSALGHAKASETLDTYTHLWPSDDDRTRNAIDDAMRASASEGASAQAE
jgi:integrase